MQDVPNLISDFRVQCPTEQRVGEPATKQWKSVSQSHFLATELIFFCLMIGLLALSQSFPPCHSLDCHSGEGRQSGK